MPLSNDSELSAADRINAFGEDRRFRRRGYVLYGKKDQAAMSCL